MPYKNWQVKLVAGSGRTYKAQISVVRSDGRIVVSYGDATGKEALAESIKKAFENAEAFEPAEHERANDLAVSAARSQQGK